MSGNPDDERIEELRQQKMQELKEQAQEGGDGAGGRADQQAAREQAEAQKQAVLKQNLTDGARQRLNAVQMSKPEVAEQVEQQIVALARSGRIQDRIDEDQMRKLLKELTPDKSFDVRHR
ncbi:DNA-binding TFAR19-related protein [Haloplanus vescus]|uniref:DNA-binding protein SAMN04488065_1289 n=1 Tax=Haloplanus vescus TaxID=555874 RepID=A0A1H3X3N0_9EURY|nr:DNA-binding protein [Haloplanus vescus]SDZ93128.1 DNA-binding TFAR19-related protein [Haloplanus vescus]